MKQCTTNRNQNRNQHSKGDRGDFVSLKTCKGKEIREKLSCYLQTLKANNTVGDFFCQKI